LNKLLCTIRSHKAAFVLGAIATLVFFLFIFESGIDAYIFATLIIFLLSFLYLYNKNSRLSAHIKSKHKQISLYQDLLREGYYFMRLDKALEVQSVNQQICDFFGMSKSTLTGKPLNALLTLEDFTENIKELIAEEGIYKGSAIYQLNNNNLPVIVTIQKTVSGYNLVLKGENESSQVTNEMREKLFIDSVTNLPTRLKLFHDIEEHKKNAIFTRSTLIYLAIDNFDALNEFFGVDAGTIILKRVAEWLELDLPAVQAKLYKIDFSHYAIFIPRFLKVDNLEEYLRKLTTRISKEEFSFQGSIFNVEITAGVARGSENLPKNAYLALKEAEKIKKNYKIYDEKEKHQERFLHNIKINKMLKEAITEHRVEPFFQPIFNIKTNQIEKYESLMRIRREDNTYATPGEFLEIAKTSKMYTELSRAMIKKCFEQLEKVQYPITINIGVEDILDSRVSQFILRNLQKHKFGKFITFEIVESESISNEIKVKNFIKKVKSYGCQIAIDDFGSGFSNFGQLLSLDADYIKIDGSLIKNITKDKDSEIMTRTIISMAKELNMKTVAEFVSSQAIFDKVKSLGVDYAQGYFIDRADPVLLKQISMK